MMVARRYANVSETQNGGFQKALIYAKKHKFMVPRKH
jgi:hypothetical protein